MSDGLPLRPNLAWFKNEAKQRLRAGDDASTLSQVQHTLAKELGFPHWRALVVAIKCRNEGARRFARHLNERNVHGVKAMMQTDRGAVLDGGCLAEPESLRWLREVALDDFAAMDLLRALFDAIVERQEPSLLADSIRAFTTGDCDWERAIGVVQDRMDAADNDPSRVKEREQLDEALSQLATYDEVENEHMIDWD